MIRGISHIGIVVKDIEKTVKKFTEAFGLPMPLIKDVSEKQMKVTLLTFGAIDIEFIEDYSEEGPFAKIVKEKGNMIHHLALLTDEIETDIQNLIQRGLPMVDLIPKVGLRGKKIAFLGPDFLDGISIELSEL